MSVPMSASQVLENTIRAEHYARAREMAKVVVGTVWDLLAIGEPPAVIHTALQTLYGRYRSSGESIERDAIAEALDWLEDEYPGGGG